ncbi:MAG: phage portal protein [bacterium]
MFKFLNNLILNRYKSIPNFVQVSADYWDNYDFYQTNKKFDDYNLYGNEVLPILHRCKSLIADSLSKLPLHIYKKTAKKGVQLYNNHDYYFILNQKVNKFQSTERWLNAMLMQMLHWGNSFSRIHYRGGKISHIEFLPIELFQSYKITKDYSLYWEIITENGTEWISDDEIIHFSTSSENGIFGMPPVFTALKNLNLVKYSQDVASWSYKNGLNSDKYLTPDIQNLDNSLIKTVSESIQKWQKKSSGIQNSGKVELLPFNTKISQFAIDFAANKILESLEYNEKSIASIYKIPAEMLNLQTSSKKNEEISLYFLNYTLQPISYMMKKELEQKMLNFDELKRGNVFIDFDYNQLFDLDTNTKMNYYKTMSGIGAMTINEIRSKQRYEKFDIDSADQPLLQAQYLKLSDITSSLTENVKTIHDENNEDEKE